MTPAMGQEPMKPMTMRRLRFIGKEEETSSVQCSTSNAQLGKTDTDSLFLVEFLHHYGGIAGDDYVR